MTQLILFLKNLENTTKPAGAAAGSAAGAATAGLGAVGGLSITTQQSSQLLSKQIFEKKTFRLYNMLAKI